MGFWGFLGFAEMCFDALAWPLFALGYPLVASINAIEINSESDSKKLITYWVLFSLISLFEHAFMELLKWLPFWHYIKFMIVFWLMIPHFDGALHVYNHLVRPCLSINLHAITKWLKRQKHLSFESNSFLAEAAKYVEANGPEALEKLLASKSRNTTSSPVKEIEAMEEEAEMSRSMMCTLVKEIEAKPKDLQKSASAMPCSAKEIEVAAKEVETPNCGEPSLTQKDIKAAQITEKKVLATAKWIPRAELNVTQSENKVSATVEIKAATNPDIALSKQAQKEWTCAVCQVSTPSEKCLSLHLQGREHKATCHELLKAKNQTFEVHVSPGKEKSAPSNRIMYDNDVKKVEPEKCQPSNELNHRTKPGPNSNIQGYKTKPQEKAQGQTKIDKNRFVGVNTAPFWCSSCSVSCTSAYDLDCHLRGRKHLARIQELIGMQAYE